MPMCIGVRSPLLEMSRLKKCPPSTPHDLSMFKCMMVLELHAFKMGKAHIMLGRFSK